MTKEKPQTIDMSLINIDPEIYPRAQIDPEVVATYSENMKAGTRFNPLVVQKDTHTLIDGVHRYHALKRLERKKAQAEILDIPDSELRAEAIRRNVKHGKRLTRKERDRSIVALRFRDGKKEKEIAEIVGLTVGRISQICSLYESDPRYFPFSNFDSKETKIDMKRKVDEKKKREILMDLEDSELSGKEIAERHDISQATVSQIKKKHEEWKSSPVYIKTQPSMAMGMLRVAFVNRMFKKARLEFKKEGVIIRNSKADKPPYVVAVFKDDFFMEYKVTQAIDGYAKSHILTQLKDVDAFSVELALVDPRTWKIRWESEDRRFEYTDLDWRDFLIPDAELDENGIPKTCTVKAEVSRHEFPRNKKGKLTLVMKNGKLSCSFKTPHGWECNKSLQMGPLVKTSDAMATVDLETLDQILRISRASTPYWIGMWGDRTDLAIGNNLANQCKFCFII